MYIGTIKTIKKGKSHPIVIGDLNRWANDYHTALHRDEVTDHTLYIYDESELIVTIFKVETL